MKINEPITVRARKDIVAQLDALASQVDRSRNYLVNQAIEEFLALRQYQIGKIKKGIASADRGELVSHEQVFADIKSKRSS